MTAIDHILFGALVFFWGASLGSFTNVLIHRIPLDMSIVSPRSSCPSCHHMIRWYENIPVLSYLFLRGRCRGCNISISPRYLFIELGAGLWSLALAQRFIWPVLSRPELWIYDYPALYAVIAKWMWFTVFICALLAITFIDLRYTFIPDEISIPMIFIGCFGGFAIPSADPLASFWGLLGGAGVILCVRWLGWLIFQREAMGLGDAKLLAVIGAFLGWRVLPHILFLSAFQGIIAALLASLYTRFTGKSNALTLTSAELDERFGEIGMYPESKSHLVIPFGPFLCLAAFEVLEVGADTLLQWWVDLLLP